MYPSAVVLFAVAICILSLWIRWRKRKLSLLKRYGIPGPEPNFFTGNLKEFNEKRDTCIKEWLDKYGNMVGFYFGAFPCIICSDVEFLKIMQIKEFKNFANKDFFLPDSGIPHKLCKNLLHCQRDEKWKNMRTILSTSFTTGKLKMMSTLMVEPTNIFIKKIENQSNEHFNITEFYKKLVFDMVCRAILGIKTNVQNSEVNRFVQSVYITLGFGSSKILERVSICFPELEPVPTLLRNIVDVIRNMMNLPSVTIVFDKCREIIDSRKKSKYHLKDILQNMLDVEDDSKDEDKTLTSESVLANTVEFLTAAYDTTSSTLEWCTYYITKYPEVQDKIRQEINDNVSKNEAIQYSDLINFPYLDQVISETLRLRPISEISINRISEVDFKYKDMVIPKGAKVMVPVYNLHRDPNYWHEPDVFDPDRFSPAMRGNIDPIIYQPFGAGPRMCIGMRMAQTILKLTLANLIRSFRLELCREEDIEIEYTMLFSRAKNGLSVKAVPLYS